MTGFRCRVAVGLLLLGATTVLGAEDDDWKEGWHYDAVESSGHGKGIHYQSPEKRFEIGIANRLQFRGTSTDPELGSGGNSFDVPRYQLQATGSALENWRFRVQVNFAEGSETSEELLEDAWVQYAKHRLFKIRLGQGKVHFGRQFITQARDLQFVDRSIASERFAHGRDRGVAIVGESESETYEYSVGVYNGNGINRDVDENQNYLISSRIVMMPLGRCEAIESDPDWTDPKSKMAVGVSVMTNNTGTGGTEEERINTAGIELAFRKAGFSFNSEFYTQNEDELLAMPGDEVETDGWYAQTGYLWRIGELIRLEIAGRYSEILRDTPNFDTSETGVAVNLYFRGHGSKLQADYRDLDFEGIPATGNTDTTEFRIQVQLIF